MMNYNESNFTQEVQLPSKGLFNPEIPEGKLLQRCMMVSDQKFLNSSNQASGSKINQIVQRTIVEPKEFDVNSLTLADTFYLLFKLRQLSYGSEYGYKTRCPECGKKLDVVVDLSELEVETLEDNYADSLVAVLPHRGDTVYTRVMTNEDLNQLNQEIARRKKKNPDDDSEYILRIVYSINKIRLAKDKTELTHLVDIERYVNTLTDLDASAILHARDSLSYGVSPRIERTCPHCKEHVDLYMSFSGDFFRPNFN